jgi:hypothetical protein
MKRVQSHMTWSFQKFSELMPTLLKLSQNAEKEK